MTARIVKAVSDFYYLYCNGTTYTGKARGIFKKNKNTPLVGDMVEIELTHTSDIEANIIYIYPRSTSLSRPAVANVDQAIIVFATTNPEPVIYLLDSFLVIMENLGLDVIIVFNKADLDKKRAEEFAAMYENIGYKTIVASVYEDFGIEKLRTILKDHVSVFAGASGVGKSSLINTLSGYQIMETGTVSIKNKRGKQTTRHTQLSVIDKDTFIVDTPGFSSTDVTHIDIAELAGLFREFRPYNDKCRFCDCIHINEPDCAVKAALEAGDILCSRYDSYLQMHAQISVRR